MLTQNLMIFNCSPWSCFWSLKGQARNSQRTSSCTCCCGWCQPWYRTRLSAKSHLGESSIYTCKPVTSSFFEAIQHIRPEMVHQQWGVMCNCQRLDAKQCASDHWQPQLMQLPEGVSRKVQECCGNVWFKSYQLLFGMIFFCIMKGLPKRSHVIIFYMCFFLGDPIIKARCRVVHHNMRFPMLPDNEHWGHFHPWKELCVRERPRPPIHSDFSLLKLA